MRAVVQRILKIGWSVILGGFVVATGAWAAFLATQTSPPVSGPMTTASSAEPSEKLQRVGRDVVTVPESFCRNMGLRTATVTARTRSIPLPALQGCLALDTNQLARIHSRFAGEVISVGTRAESGQPSPASPLRPFQVGDPVSKGELLAVVWSKDLGEKKSELVDAVSKLRSDDVTLNRLDAGFRDGSIPERSLRDAERSVESDRIAVEKAERTLRAWRLTEDEIKAIRAESESVKAPKADPTAWARVEVRSPQDGVILEKNVTAGDIVDTSADLFKVGDLSRLVVWVHVYEEDLPLLQSLPKPVRWTVRLPSRPGTSFAGQLDQVGAVIDPNQHTALATGRVDNPAGDLKVGQFVTVAVDLPPPSGDIELPADAVVEDGRESVVFVRAPGQEERFVRTQVRVTSRFRDALCVRTGGGVGVGDRVVTGGSLLLRDAMDQLPVPQN